MRLDTGWVEDRVSWLLKNGSAPVRYLTTRHLRSDPPEPGAGRSLAAEVAATFSLARSVDACEAVLAAAAAGERR